jgi:hypothetical protein
MKKALLFAILALSINAFAQTPDWLWAKSMGGTFYQSGISTADLFGNVYTTGYFSGTVDFDPGTGTFNLTSAGNYDIFVTKTNASGNFIWAKRMGGTYNNLSYAITIDSLGNVYTTGFFTGTADFDPGIGTFNLTAAGGTNHTFISKLDKDGNFVWAKSIGGTGDANGYSIALDTASNVYISGLFAGSVDFNPGTEIFDISSVDADMFISKLDPEGNFVWAKTIGAVGNYANTMAIDISGNVYAACYIVGTVDFDPGAGIFNLTPSSGNYSGVISKLDASGNFVWAKQIDKTVINSLAIDASDNIYSTGSFTSTVDFDPGAGIFNLSSSGSSDIFISKLNSSGDFGFAKQLGGTGENEGTSIALDNDGNIYTAGDFQGTADFDPGTGSFSLYSIGSGDIFVSKLDKLGNFVWAESVGGTGDDRCGSSSIHLDELGNIYLSGGFASPSISFGSTTLLNASNTGANDIFIAKLGKPITTGVTSVANINSFSVYPNPINGKFTISNNSNISSIEIFNLSGTRVYSDFKFKKQTLSEIDLTGYAKGIYLVKIYDGTKSQSRKVIVQ